MKRMYHIEITDGIWTLTGSLTSGDQPHYAPSAVKYFAARGVSKPSPLACRGWPFRSAYLTHGDETSGFAVAWATS